MSDQYDLVVVGYGPAGQAAAASLGRRGHHVLVLERQPGAYAYPRAGAFDHEVMRAFQSLGVAERIEAVSVPSIHVEMFGAGGVKLTDLVASVPPVSGWQEGYTFYQPELEQILDAAVQAMPTVDVQRGQEVVGLLQDADGVELTVRDAAGGTERVVSGRYVIGADGANSFVRTALGVERTRLGEPRESLVVDVRPHDPDMEWAGATGARQIADPDFPRYNMRWVGREHVRLEFLLAAGTDREAMVSDANCWALMAETGLTAQNATVVRRTIYTFEALLAETWRSGRVFLAGDAAHLMPPMLAQGMCSGIRDAVNLAWKLDLVLAGNVTEPDRLLDTYQQERLPHSRQYTEMSAAIAAIIATSDHEAAAQRDAAIVQYGLPMLQPPTLESGLLALDEQGKVSAPVGHLAPQGRVLVDGRVGRFDDVFGVGWRLISRRAIPAEMFDGHHELIDRLGIRAVHVTPAKVPGAAIDIDYTYAEWFRVSGVELIIVRPDFYVFAAAARPDQLPALLDTLSAQLPVRPAHERLEQSASA